MKSKKNNKTANNHTTHTVDDTAESEHVFSLVLEKTNFWKENSFQLFLIRKYNKLRVFTKQIIKEL